MVGKKGFTENFRGISLYHKKIGVDCSSSLPYRQLRKVTRISLNALRSSLPYRQLRNVEIKAANPASKFTAVQAA